MKNPPIHNYALIMKEIKRRMEVVDYFITGRGTALYKPTTIESICLQIRKILELIAMASLVANAKEYAEVHANFRKHWNAELLLKDLEKINPRFYPRPIKEAPAEEEGITAIHEPLKKGFLTKDKFVEVYKKCGAMMHADNPFGKQKNYQDYDNAFIEWTGEIVVLLNCHQVMFKDYDGVWLIHMKEDGDEDVHYYNFEPAPPKDC